jgi:plasmid maintenance system antidote protein VapI
MSINDFAEIMGVSRKEAESMLMRNNTIILDLNEKRGGMP